MKKGGYIGKEVKLTSYDGKEWLNGLVIVRKNSGKKTMNGLLI